MFNDVPLNGHTFGVCPWLVLKVRNIAITFGLTLAVKGLRNMHKDERGEFNVVLLFYFDEVWYIFAAAVFYDTKNLQKGSHLFRLVICTSDLEVS